MFNIKFLIVTLAITFIPLIGCTSPHLTVTEFSNIADPEQEMNRIDVNLKQTQLRHVDVLSPTYFQLAKDSLNQAKDGRNQNLDQSSVLHKIAMSQAYLNKANSFTDIASHLLPDTIQERQNALTEKAEEYFPKEFVKADEALIKETKKIENNDISGAEKKHGELADEYRHLELIAIKHAKIGPAKQNMLVAINEGAKELTPETLVMTEENIKAAELVIENDPHNNFEINKATAKVIKSSNDLIDLVREAKSAKGKNPEQLAKQTEKAKQKAAKSNEELNKISDTIIRKDKALTAASDENSKLKYTALFETKYEYARQQFTPDEAEVYKQGNKLLLRLKGLSFKTSQSTISPDNYFLLQKVQNVIKNFGDVIIIVEGHTDSTGSKQINLALSTERAQAVESYFVANNIVAEENISAKVFADYKPITTNKTKVGRSKNRRVDIIMTAINE